MRLFLIVLIYLALLFMATMFNQDFDTRWDDVLLSMNEVPSDDILESLYEMRTLESD